MRHKPAVDDDRSAPDAGSVDARGPQRQVTFVPPVTDAVPVGVPSRALFENSESSLGGGRNESAPKLWGLGREGTVSSYFT